jgi:hypothetical protein
MSDGLTSMLEALPLYENLNQKSDEPAVFDDDREPSSGLINLIRRNSYLEDETTFNSSDPVRTLVVFTCDGAGHSRQTQTIYRVPIPLTMIYPLLKQNLRRRQGAASMGY